MASQGHLLALQETCRSASWPLQSFLELTAVPGDVSAARRHVRHVLRSWELPAVSDDTELVVSELVSNAVAISAATNQQDIRLWLLSDGRQVLILTWDASPDPPQIARPAADAENGRGLILVEALSKQWGWYFAAGLGGKVIWVFIDPDHPCGTGSSDRPCKTRQTVQTPASQAATLKEKRRQSP
ncbi:MAG: ATP-binding protein [Actinobacteria bacterium]|nr:ATP-binding protein [Actinomycetota bacterium]